MWIDGKMPPSFWMSLFSRKRMTITKVRGGGKGEGNIHCRGEFMTNDRTQFLGCELETAIANEQHRSSRGVRHFLSCQRSALAGTQRETDTAPQNRAYPNGAFFESRFPHAKIRGSRLSDNDVIGLQELRDFRPEPVMGQLLVISNILLHSLSFGRV